MTKKIFLELFGIMTFFRTKSEGNEPEDVGLATVAGASAAEEFDSSHTAPVRVLGQISALLLFVKYGGNF
jgi:hypothetical protein